ncbi:hypothetical protein Q760_03110 [Cellulomonas cellasea DSM 20118]|uniref:Uncharacterized protein n=2 Tax=Cellulomonas cellasea TaxID=43670 RepID=A0A0A0BBG3_9CELL|nr:hypothetical protein Q760_03110 [Cellulomonas cellasea DSM 20118]
MVATAAHEAAATPSDPANDEGAPVVEVMGVRHHGPGSARAVRAALERLRPDVVLVEGPADADALAPLAGDPDLVPPVAMLAYANDDPATAVFWPYAVFSPEWQALRWAAQHGVRVRFCDLPSGAVLARGGAEAVSGQRPETLEPAGVAGQQPATTAAPPPAAGPGQPESLRPAQGHRPAEAPGGAHAAEREDPSADDDTEPEDPSADGAAALRRDPVAALAAAAGYDDPERWWDDVVEHRLDSPTPFPVLTEAMAELRWSAEPLPPARQLHEDRREAHMRQALRAELRAGARRVAVVCGAWHAPALDGRLPPAAADVRVLRGLPRRATSVTWVPWTSSRLATASSYGAGITSPGWYHHLFTAPDHVVARWLTRVAGVLRAQDLPVSSAHVIEAVRLADALATLRGRPLAGLDEVTEATRAVLCEGDDAVLALVTARLVVGESLGTVPESVPTVPLASDLRATARRLRLKVEPLARTLELDVRKDTDRERSRLLHRLRVLDVDWGVPAAATRRSTGTFREPWTLVWRPELAVAVIEAALWGTTVEAAAAARLGAAAGPASLAGLTRLVEDALLADLPAAMTPLLAALDARAAHDVDVVHLMTALPPLVRAHRYPGVRGTDVEQVGRVADALLVRVCAALPSAVTALDDEAARELRTALDAVHDAVLLREEPAGAGLWWAALASLADRGDVSGLLAGRATRLLRDGGRLDDAPVRLARALSVGAPAPAKAAWVEGFLDGGGLLLARDDELLTVLDTWLAGLPERDFTDVLPLLRRTFGALSAPERRAVRQAAAHGTRRPAGPAEPTGLDEERALPALRTVTTILGGHP